MVKISLCLLIATAAAAQTEIDGGGSVTLDSGVVITLRTVAEPAMPASALQHLIVGFRGDGNSMRFQICDDATRRCFGFRLRVYALDLTGARAATFGPAGPEGSGMSVESERKRFEEAPLAKYPMPQKIRPGDTIALDVMVSADGKERIVEYLKFDFENGGVTLRDFTIDDGPITYAREPAPVGVQIDGLQYRGTTTFSEGKGGATVWIYLPGRGRYILSLVPHEGFVKAGFVRANVMAFSADGREYRIHLGKPLVATAGPWNLYVLHDATFLPPKAIRDDVFVSCDRLENLLPKH